jgi:hypothetical protein
MLKLVTINCNKKYVEGIYNHDILFLQEICKSTYLNIRTIYKDFIYPEWNKSSVGELNKAKYIGYRKGLAIISKTNNIFIIVREDRYIIANTIIKDEDVLLVNVHLPSGEGCAFERKEVLNEIHKFIGNKSAIIAGDFNMREEEFLNLPKNVIVSDPLTTYLNKAYDRFLTYNIHINNIKTMDSISDHKILSGEIILLQQEQCIII